MWWPSREDQSAAAVATRRSFLQYLQEHQLSFDSVGLESLENQQVLLLWDDWLSAFHPEVGERELARRTIRDWRDVKVRTPLSADNFMYENRQDLVETEYNGHNLWDWLIELHRARHPDQWQNVDMGSEFKVVAKVGHIHKADGGASLHEVLELMHDEIAQTYPSLLAEFATACQEQVAEALRSDIAPAQEKPRRDLDVSWAPDVPPQPAREHRVQLRIGSTALDRTFPDENSLRRWLATYAGRDSVAVNELLGKLFAGTGAAQYLKSHEPFPVDAATTAILRSRTVVMRTEFGDPRSAYPALAQHLRELLNRQKVAEFDFVYVPPDLLLAGPTLPTAPVGTAVARLFGTFGRCTLISRKGRGTRVEVKADEGTSGEDVGKLVRSVLDLTKPARRLV